MIKSLHARHHAFAQQERQVELLEASGVVPFKEKLETIGFWPLQPSAIEIFQVK